jgi:hypothetical protein
MYNPYYGLNERQQTLRLKDQAPEEIRRAEAELVRLMSKHQQRVGDFALVPELREAAERLQRLLHQHETAAVGELAPKE